MTESEFPLDEILAMQKRFTTLYRTTGLISICSNYIQVRLYALMQLCDQETWTTDISLKMMYPVRYSATIEGVKFCSVCTRKEAEEVGLVLTAAQLILLDERKS